MFVSVAENVPVKESVAVNCETADNEERENYYHDLNEVSAQDKEALKYIAGYVAQFSSDQSLKHSPSSTLEVRSTIIF
ncbi:hypothetical protein PR048_012713 [Dryococelus australis]|uniref:Uncharacterized protein n=1 Tax=Dryococelus australis TaxID=614101 RepID=A0ABQ9HQ45_9NEOP|nr:hypothetical protein PR048_012713 [Dryococelus australis]